MNRDPLREALRSLPRERAGAEFTPRLLERLAAEGGAATRPLAVPRPAWRAFAAAAALAALLAAGGATLARFAQRPEAGSATAGQPARRARLQRIEVERARLSAELQELKRMADTDEPVIYLGGDDRVDLVLDVGRLARRRESGPAPRVEPAAYHPDDRP